MNCQYKWTNRIDEEDDQGSSWESEPEGEKGPNGTESPDVESEWTQAQHSITLLKVTRTSRCLEDSFIWSHETLEELKVTVVVDSGAAENVMPRSVFPEISTEETERSKNGKGVQRTRMRAHQQKWTASHVRQNS